MKKTRIILCLLLNVMIISSTFLSVGPASAIGGTYEGEIPDQFLQNQTEPDDLLKEESRPVPYEGPYPDRDLPPWQIEEENLLNESETSTSIPPRDTETIHSYSSIESSDDPMEFKTSEYILQDTNGLYYSDSNATKNAERLEERSTGGPDGFGYTWDDSITLDWIDASGGTDTGISTSVEYSGPVDLGFNFKFYENTYSQIYISRHGFFSFNNVNLTNWQSPVPSTELPDDVIAPFWVPSDDIAYVRYLTGGSSPNRWIVIEWNNLLSDSYDVLHYYTFQAILHENGNITFQYGETIEGWGYCGAAGIENITGTDGLTVIEFCEPFIADRAVLISRPPDAPRMSLTPQYQGDLFTKDQPPEYQVTVVNSGDLGADTFDITSSSSWPMTIYQSDGVTSLIDTDSDGIIDTGLMEPGDSLTFNVKIDTPDPIKVGDHNTVLIDFVSSIDMSVVKTATISSALPANFAQVYRNDDLDSLNFNLYGQDFQSENLIDEYGVDLAVAELGNGNFIYLWSDYRWIDSDHYVYEVKYTLFDHGGNQIAPIMLLSDLGTPSTTVWDEFPAVAVSPDGNIGVLWYRHRRDNVLDIDNYNIVFSILDQGGNVIHAPEEITANDVWGSSCYGELDMPCYYSPRIAATEDNHFSLAFDQEITEPADSNTYVDIFFGIRDSLGGAILSLTNFTRDVTGAVYNFTPSITSMNGNELLLTWYGDGLQYAVLDSYGNVVNPITSTGYDYGDVDAIQLPGGNVMMAGEGGNEIQFLILDNTTYALKGSITTISNPTNQGNNGFVSITSDSQGDAILTWMDSDYNYKKNLYYALVNETGTIITPPIAYRSSSSEILSSSEGYGNTTYTPMASVSLTPSHQAGFGGSSEPVEHSLTVTNTGNLGPDSFDISVTSDFSASVFADDGVTPITETDPLDLGQTFTFIVKIDIPSSAVIGDSGSTVVTATSNLEPSKYSSAMIDLTVPAPFSQALFDNSFGAGLYLVQPEAQSLKEVPLSAQPGSVGVVEMPGGNFVYAGAQMYMSWDGTGDPLFFYDLRYAIFDHGGDIILPQTFVDQSYNSNYAAYVEGPVVDVAPNGNIGILWIEQLQDLDTDLSNFNIFLLVLDSEGNTVTGPTNLTGNVNWGSNATNDSSGFESPRIAASEDGKFFITWAAYDQGISGYLRDIYFGVRNNDGSQNIASTKLTNGVIGGEFNYEPALTSLENNKALIAWHGSGQTKYVVINNDSSFAKTSTTLSGPGMINSDAVQLSDGNIFLAGQNENREIYFSILDGSTYQVNNPLTALLNPFAPSSNMYVSVTRDENGHGILTWAGYQTEFLYYALVNGSGDVLTTPTILREAEEYQYKFIYTNNQGYGNTTYSPAAWFDVLSDEIYGFVSEGRTYEYDFDVQNLGSLGPDRFEFNINLTGWSFTLFEPDGITPLTDTDSDGTIDTGFLAEGEVKTIVAKVTVPPTAVVGDHLQGSITATSELNPDLNKPILVSLAIPAPFAQIYDEDIEGLHLALVQSETTQDIPLGGRAGGMAVMEMPNGNLLNIWDETRCNDKCVSEIKYEIINNIGENVIPTTVLVDHSDATIHTFDYSPAIWVLPNGNIGVTWYREKQDSMEDLLNYNIFFALLSENGTISYGPVNLTNNDVWGNSNLETFTSFTNPSITGTSDGYFMLAWSRYDSLSSSGTSDVYYAIYGADGTEILPPDKVTESTPDVDVYYRPHLLNLHNDDILLHWFKYDSVAQSLNPQVLVFDNTGSVVKNATDILGDVHSFEDGVQLSDGSIFLAGSGLDSEIYYAILDGTSYSVTLSPTKLSNLLRSDRSFYLSVTSDQEGHAILTWKGYPFNSSENHLLYYSLVDNDGSVITPPTIMAASEYLNSSYNGMGNTTYSPVTYQNTSPTITSTAVIEATQDSTYSYAISASDPDISLGDTLTLSAPILPDWLTLIDNGGGTGTLSGMPSNSEVGSHDVEILVTDSGGLTDSQAFTISVEDVNDQPYFTSTAVTQATQDIVYTYNVIATDPDLDYGDTLTISTSTIPDWLTLTDNGNGSATLTGTPTSSDISNHQVDLVVTDKNGLSAYQSFTIVVKAQSEKVYIYLPLIIH